MPAAPLPPNENERIEILDRYAILDTFPEQQYDDLTFLASQICGTPISMLSLIDRDRQWCKSFHGLDSANIPRDISFCAHAILRQDVTEVRDTTRDTRFASNVMVTGDSHIRFYAGAPLITPDGFSLGTLCVADRKPRQLSPEQLRSLEALARQAVAQMELWRSFRQLEIAAVERSIALSVAEETTKRLVQTQTRFQQFMDNSPVMAVIKDEQGRYLYVNKPLEKTFDVTFEQLKGKDDCSWLPPIEAEAVMANDRKVLESGQILEGIEIVTTPDGRQREWLIFKFPIEEGEGVRHLGVVGLDVTQERQSARLKSEFVSVVSHELRTPLTSIRGALGLLAGGVAGEMPPAARQMIDIAQKNGDRLILLINDILDIEKIESGQMRFDLRAVELLPWLQNSVEQNRSYGATLGVQIEISECKSLEKLCVMADPHRLDQVLSNLLSNACKWTPRGGSVRISAEIAGAQLLISVADEGPGVPTEFVPHLFEKFGQADASATRKNGGTGLGLAITRAILANLSGRIEYIAPESGAGNLAKENAATGATFRFSLPLCPKSLDEIGASQTTANDSKAVARPAASELKTAPKSRILICEDDVEVADLLGVVAAQNGYEAIIASTLDEARTRFTEGDFAGMTLDLRLPDGDGLDLLRELRAVGNEVPVVVISATSEEGKLHGEALSVLDWLEKPFDATRLRAALQGFKSDEGAWLLHVEDDADVQSVVAAILGEGVHIVTANTLAQARQQLETRRFDLAILDLELRDGNGLDLIDELNASQPPTPVILFSTRESSAEQGHRVDAALVKSRAGNDELRDTIRRVLGREIADETD